MAFLQSTYGTTADTGDRDSIGMRLRLAESIVPYRPGLTIDSYLNRPEPIAHLYVPQLAAMPFPRRGRQDECLDRFLMIAGRDDFVLVYHKHGMGDVDTGIEQRHALDLPFTLHRPRQLLAV